MSAERVSISARVVEDSFYNGSRLTTLEATFPRFLLPEFNTHRVISRNSASSRAIPVWKKLREVLHSPFIPQQFGVNKAGMQSTSNLPVEEADAAAKNWLVGRDVAVIQAFVLAGGKAQVLKDSKNNPQAFELCDQILELSLNYRDVVSKMTSLSVGVHKQHANRVLEPYSWHTIIMTASQWRNFYSLRASLMAQPEIQTLAIEMARAHSKSTPKKIEAGEWHLPYIFPTDRTEVQDPILLARISSGRCARVSYLTHDGIRSLDADLGLAEDLQNNGHTSPFEHPATTDATGELGGNFGFPWKQYRKMLPNEHDFSRLISRESLFLGMKEDQGLVDFVLDLDS